MRKITSFSGAMILILALCGFVYAADTGSENDGAPFYTKDYDGPHNMNETPMTYFEPFLTVDNDTLTPLADNISDLTLFLCQGDQEWTLLKEYTGWQDVNRFGIYSDIGVGNNRTLIFSGGHGEGFFTFTAVDPSTEIGLWLHNDTNNDSIYNGDDSFLFSETTLSKGTLAQEHQWFMVYDVSAYIGMGKTFTFECPTENFSVTGDFHYLVYIDDNHTSSNFDHNDMILGVYCANTPPEVTCPGDMDMLVCSQDQVEVAGFDIFDAEDNIETIECSVGTYADGSVFFTPTVSGDYEIVLTVTDAFGQSASCTTMVTVEMNSPPTCIVPESGVIVQCTPTEVCLPAFAEDVDGNLIGCEIVSGPGQLVDGNWCYTPSGDESVDVTMVCTDECEEFCEVSFSIEFVMQPNWAVLTMDRTGSMSLTNAFGESRILRAKDLAHTEIDKLVDMNDTDYPGVFEVAIYYFNSSEGVILAQDFTSDAQTLHDAIDAIPGPRHDTPLAAA
ncbi:MAG: hypothetical protein GF310_11410, partial [candidate division Zixibacteria bacterium]|nr:hypothetical protein [candidate division Zixibacteria bacterium]